MGNGIRAITARAFAASLFAGASVCATAVADDAPPTERERKLEQRIEEMQKQIDDLARRAADGSNRAGDELTQRVEELEKLSKKDKDGLFPYWGNGIRMDGASGAFKIRIGGRIQDDWAWFWSNEHAEEFLDTQVEAGAEFRRARLYVGGTIYKNVDFNAEYDFAGGAVVARDVTIAVKDLCFGTLTVGNQKEPVGTEQLTSDLYTPFMERSAGNESLGTDYANGFMASNNFAENEGVWQFGIFRPSAASGNDIGNNRSGEYNFTGRLAGRPWKGDDGSYMTASLSASLRTPVDDMAQFRSRPQMHIAPRFIDTGTVPSDRVRVVEADAGFVANQFWIYADYFHSQVNVIDGSDGTLHAWHVAAGVFLTGESKPYKAASATYDRIKPKKNFGDGDGMGTWEIVGRMSGVDLNDGDIAGGRLRTWALGVNWYLNPNTRWVLEFIRTMRRDQSFAVNGVQTRFQIDF